MLEFRADALATNKVKHKLEDPRHNRIILPKLRNIEVKV
jgi:hypothetical protein